MEIKRKIVCHNTFCIFNDNLECKLKGGIEIDRMGNCINVYIPTYFKGLSQTAKQNYLNLNKDFWFGIYKQEAEKYLERVNNRKKGI